MQQVKEKITTSGNFGMDEFKVVPVSMVYWKSSIRTFTQEDVENMSASLMVHGQIQPIVVKPPDAEGLHEGVCGRLRYEGAKHAHRREVLARVHNFEDEAEVLEWQIVENLHRKDLTAIQRGEAYKQLYEVRRKELGGVKDKSIVVGMAESIEKQTGEKKAERTIRRYIQVAKELPDKIKGKMVVDDHFGIEHARQLLRLKDKPKVQLQLAEKFVQKPMTVQKLKQEVNKILKPFGFQANPFNIWGFSNCDERFGFEGYRGRVPGQIVQNCLYFFAPSKDAKIVDPMAGSGTTFDVCKQMGYANCLCYDINSEEINQQRIKKGKEQYVDFNDVREGLPKVAHDADFIFLDPYYYDMVTDFQSLEEFKSFIFVLAEKSMEALNNNGRVAILMADLTRDKVFIYLRAITYDIFKQCFGEPLAVVSVPMTTNQASGQEVNSAREKRKLLGRDRTLFVFRK